MTFLPPNPGEPDESIHTVSGERPTWMEPSHEYDGPSRIPLSKQSVMNRDDNPHELLTEKCSSCRLSVIASRNELHEEGWQIAVETRIEDHMGFMLCPECSKQEYIWEDLY